MPVDSYKVSTEYEYVWVSSCASSNCNFSHQWYTDAPTITTTGVCSSSYVVYEYCQDFTSMGSAGNEGGISHASFGPGQVLPEDTARKIKEYEDAQARARRLLLSILTPLQRRQFEKHGFFEVVSSDGAHRYAIYSGRVGNVYRLDDAGKAVLKLCGHPAINCPDPDTMLAQKFALEHDAAAFERVANSHPLDMRGMQHEYLRQTPAEQLAV